MAKQVSKQVSKDTRQENTVNLIVKVMGILILATVIGFMIFGDRSDCGIDKATIACRWNSTMVDWVGIILFVASALYLFGFFPAIFDDATGKQGYRNGLVGFIGAIAGMALIWLN